MTADIVQHSTLQTQQMDGTDPVCQIQSYLIRVSIIYIDIKFKSFFVSLNTLDAGSLFGNK